MRKSSLQLRYRDYYRVLFTTLLFSAGIFLLLAGVLSIFEVQLPDSATSMISILLSLVLVFFTGMIWMTYEKLADLADLQNEISKHNFWLTDELQSNSKTQLILRAHELGIPVMYWDPNEETWDPNKQPWHPGRGHRKIAQMPLVIMYLPKHERKENRKYDFSPMKVAKPFSKSELKTIEAERKRLNKRKTKRKRARGTK